MSRNVRIGCHNGGCRGMGEQRQMAIFGSRHRDPFAGSYDNNGYPIKKFPTDNKWFTRVVVVAPWLNRVIVTTQCGWAI
jgi:hypothetical protein